MDGRRAIWLTCGVLIALAGCTKSVTNPAVPQPPPPSAKALKPPDQPLSPDAIVTKRDKLGDPKPATWVQLAGVKAELAANPNQSQADKEAFAQQAKEYYAKALKADPKYVPAFMGLGALYESIGERDEALKNYRAATKIEPKNAPAHLAVARVYRDAKQYEDAFAAYAAATKEMPREATIWFEMGTAYGKVKEFDQALACWQKAAEIRPKNEEYCKAVGFMLARMGRVDEAVPWLARAYAPHEAEAHFQLAGLLRQMGRHDMCREQLNVALQIDPNHGGALQMVSEFPRAIPAPVQTAAAKGDANTAAAVQPATTLPTRPMIIQTAGQSQSQPRPLPPLMPVVSEQFDNKPPPPPSLSGPVSRKGPTVTIGFDANP